MFRQRYPNFRRAQRDRGPFFRRPRPAVKNRFKAILVASSAATFTLVLVGDRLPELLDRSFRASRNLGRDHAPPAGAYYPGCDAARAEGVAPLYRGEPGYRPEMDGDSDGVACEPYRGI